MTDYIWNEENKKIIAKLVLSEDIQPGQRARLSNQDTCAIRENGAYTDNHNSDVPILRPKPGILGRLIGKKVPERDHLFVHNGPHDVDLKINASWRSGQRGGVVAHMTVNISPREVGPLFVLADRSEGMEITPDSLANEVTRNVAGRFAEYVMGLNDKPTTEEELRSHEDKFAQIADNELGELGVHVASVVLRYEDDSDATVSQVSRENAASRRAARERDFHRFSGDTQDVQRGMGIEAAKAAKESDLGKAAAKRIERQIVEVGEDALSGQLEEKRAEGIHDAERRKIERDGAIMKTKADVVRSMRPESEEDE